MAKHSIEPTSDDETEGTGESLLKKGSRGDGGGAMSVGELGERVAEHVEFGDGGIQRAANLENQAGVNNVLAGGAPMNEAGGF